MKLILMEMVMTEEKLRQLFKNNSDCYTEIPKTDADYPGYVEFFTTKLIPAMTEDGFIWALRTAGLITI